MIYLTSKILECHSRGDTRFSPMFCEVQAFGRFDTIENHYQRTKRFRHKETGKEVQARNWKEAKKLQTDHANYEHKGFYLPNGFYLGNSSSKEDDLVIQWYILLWVKYLTKHPELIEEAKNYDIFVDIFEGKFPYSQAKVFRDVSKYGIKFLKNKGEELVHILKEYGNGNSTT